MPVSSVACVRVPHIDDDEDREDDNDDYDDDSHDDDDEGSDEIKSNNFL